MGLDGVELLMSVEEHFGITIKNDEAAQIRSVGDFVNLIRSRIVAAETLSCPSRLKFYELRRLTAEVTGKPNLRIRPSQRIESTLSRDERRQLWKRLPEILGTDPRDLGPPTFLRRLLWLIAWSILIGSIGYALTVDVLFLPIAVLASSFIGILLILFGSCFRSAPPNGWETFGKVTRQLAGTVAVTKGDHRDSDEAILEQLRQIIADVLGVKPDKIVASALLIADLGMD